MTGTRLVAAIPSPEQGVWQLGPVPLRAYALCIIAGVVVALWVGEKRLVARGAAPGQASDIAVWAIPFGLVGARLYHVVTTPELYFAEGGDPVAALYVWEGGLGIWGAIGLGAVGAWLACRHYGVRFHSYADALAPGIVLAQAIGRVGNYFNQELFGSPTDLPWGLEIAQQNRPAGFTQVETFHPTFLYEALWCAAVAVLITLVDRRARLGWGRVFALYVALYCIGRAFIENLRIDEVHELGPWRLNVYVSLVMFVLALAYFVLAGRRHPVREQSALSPSATSGTQEPLGDEDADEPDADAGDDAGRSSEDVGTPR